MTQAALCSTLTHPLRVAVIDPDPFARFGLAEYLDSIPEVTLVGDSAYPAGARINRFSWRAELLVLSVDPPHGPVFLQNLLNDAGYTPGLKVLLMANLLDPFLLRSLYDPAICGYLLKSEAGDQLAFGLTMAAGGAWVMTRTVCSELAKLSMQPANPALIGM